MTPRIPLPKEIGASFTVSQAAELGVGPRRLWGPDLERPFWGVRARTGSLDDLPSIAGAYAARMPRLAFFSHATAAQLWSIPLPLHLQEHLPLHVSVPDPRRAPEGVGVAGHRLHLTREDVTTLHGLRITSLERTVLDLAAILDNEGLLAALDSALWRRRSASLRATPASFSNALNRFRGRRGRSRFLELLPLASNRSDSYPESVFRYRFIRAAFPEPVANQNVFDADGHFIAMPDLQFTHYRMAFDYEGDHHRTDARQWRKDLRRVPLLEDAQWHHTRISADDLLDSRDLIARTSRRLRERGWTG